MKEVELNFIIDKDGKIQVEPKGTEGSECLDLMAFLDRIPGFEVLETITNDDMKKKKVVRNTNQRISN